VTLGVRAMSGCHWRIVYGTPRWPLTVVVCISCGKTLGRL
jgi:ribosomal protein S27E